MNNKKIVIYNPATSSLNMGDHIISDAAYKQLYPFLKESFLVEISTHLPVSNYLKYTKDFDYKFVFGSNLLRGKMNRLFRQWDINIFNSNMVGPSILVGAGWWQYGDDPNKYTKKLYSKVLSSDYIHSVRDSYTEHQLRSIGINNVINTSCPTMWDLTPEHCQEIPQSKSDEVVTTITDYNKDLINDKRLLEILCKAYKKVYLWIQGTEDLTYFNNLEMHNDNIEIVPPNLGSYDRILQKDVDYVGTRLHAGVRALQKKKRTIIIAIDNRAIEKQKDFNLVCVMRENIEDLPQYINGSFSTQIKIPINNIEEWKSQFI